MKKFLLLTVFMAVVSNLFAEAAYVYHSPSQTVIDGTNCNTPYRSLGSIIQSNQTMSIAFKAEWVGYTTEARIYYTTDGSNPGGAYGVPDAGSSVVICALECSFCNCGPGGINVLAYKGTIPALPGGGTIKYIVSAGKPFDGDEIFSEGCGNCGTESRPSSNADVYSFAVLPIELTRFDVKKGDNFTTLHWETASETNNRAFQIERSPDAQNWETLDQVAGAGNSFEQKKYDWTDRQPLDGTSYYRLRQFDFDGLTSLSPVRKVERTGAVVFSVFPNPTVSSTTVKTISSTEGEALIDLVDATGRYSGTVHFQLQKGENLLEMPLGGMPGGWYTLIYSAANGHFSQRIFIKSE